MGLARLETIADNLILAGRSVDEPAAVISRLSLPGAERRIGTLGDDRGRRARPRRRRPWS